MDVPERITISRLTEAYGRIGFCPQVNQPLTFENGNRLMLFHASYRGDVFLADVLGDIERTETLNQTEERLKDRLFEQLAELFADEVDPA